MATCNIQKAVSDYCNLVELVFNSRNQGLQEYLDFVQSVEKLKHSTTFADTLNSLSGPSSSIFIDLAAPEEYWIAIVFALVQKLSKNSLSKDFKNYTIDDINTMHRCLGALYKTGGMTDRKTIVKISV